MTHGTAAPGTFEFLIDVGDPIADGYRLTVGYPDPDSPTGTGSHTAVAALDPADAALRAQLAMLPTMVLASAARSRLAVSPMEQAARTVGDHLFRALTGGETLGELARLRRRALAAGADVRIALRIRPPELAALPWEFLFDAREDRREFLGRACMVTRSSGDLRTVPPLAVTGPLRVLAMAATPGDQAALDVERERAYLEEALAPMRAAGLLELTWVPATKQALLAETQRRHWHIVHYIGHGDFDAATGAGRLAFAAEDGAGTDWVTARQLATILGAHPTLRLVVLNACQSSAGSAEDGQAGLAAALVHAGLAAVVAMQFPITDDAAPVFGREFYGALAAGEPVDRCVRAGRAAITLANDASLEWGTPVLHLRSSDGLLFTVPGTAEHAAGETIRTRVVEPWHTADPPTDAEPWRPDPEPEPRPEPRQPADQPLGVDRALLQQIGMDLLEATDKVLGRHYSAELVADLERIVAGYVGLLGPDHPSTVSAQKTLLTAQTKLAGSRPSETPPTPPSPAPAPAAEDTAEDSEDHWRSKTTRRGAGERPSRAPRSSKAVVATPSAEFTIGADIVCLTFSSRLLGVGDGEGFAHIVENGRDVRTFANGPQRPVRQVVISPTEQNVVCLLGYGDRPDRLRFWTAAGVPMSQDGVIASHFAFHPRQMFVAGSGGHDLSLRRYEAPFSPVMPYRGLVEIGDVAVSPDGRYVAAIGDHRILVWSAFNGEVAVSFPAPEARLELGIQFSPDSGSLFASHTRSGLIRCDLATERSTPCALPALADQRPVWSLAPSGLAVGTPFYGDAGAASFWDVAWPDIDLGRLPDEVCPTVRPAFDPTGKHLAVALPDRRTVRIYALEH
ncbi:CHAT domain-containing WD40 repeat protein [Catenulispora subtropica]|uniref:CHAT domain-containing WD40 repeat protein n=1 Tax=Catenulispora subtropica TaxID=450798 RepID=UPI0031E18878